jgi:hypothetical protein
LKPTAHGRQRLGTRRIRVVDLTWEVQVEIAWFVQRLRFKHDSLLPISTSPTHQLASLSALSSDEREEYGEGVYTPHTCNTAHHGHLTMYTVLRILSSIGFSLPFDGRFRSKQPSRFASAVASGCAETIQGVTTATIWCPSKC